MKRIQVKVISRAKLFPLDSTTSLKRWFLPAILPRASNPDEGLVRPPYSRGNPSTSSKFYWFSFPLLRRDPHSWLWFCDRLLICISRRVKVGFRVRFLLGCTLSFRYQLTTDLSVFLRAKILNTSHFKKDPQKSSGLLVAYTLELSFQNSKE